MVTIEGHRGFRGHYPENTLPGFLAAADVGANGVELDLHLTKDEEVVVYHDCFLNKELTVHENGREIQEEILIRELSLEDLKQFDYKDKAHPDFPLQKVIPRTKIPTLNEVFQYIKEKEIHLNLEIKRYDLNPHYTFSPKTLAKKIVQEVQESGVSNRIYYSSFDLEVLSEIRKIDTEAILSFIADSEYEEMIEQLQALNITTLALKYHLLDSKERIKKLKASGFRVVTWTVNSLEQWKKLILHGVDTIITDYPGDLVRFVQGLDTDLPVSKEQSLPQK